MSNIKSIRHISQSLIKAVMPQDACGQYIKFRYIDHIEEPPSEVMLRGKYFEHNLIGACRGGEVPELKKLKKGGKSKAEQDLDDLIIYAKLLLDEMKLDIAGAQVQVELKSDKEGIIGNLDMITNDIQQPSRQAIYDIKYTETKQDDRWNGWADFENKYNEKTQAAQYIKLFYENFGVWVPYYFLVFGKSFWCKVIKVVVTESSIAYHNIKINSTREKLDKWEAEGWPALPEFNKCGACHYNDKCKFVATVPTIEIFQI